jgi:hypothetical protein
MKQIAVIKVKVINRRPPHFKDTFIMVKPGERYSLQVEGAHIAVSTSSSTTQEVYIKNDTYKKGRVKDG